MISTDFSKLKKEVIPSQNLEDKLFLKGQIIKVSKSGADKYKVSLSGLPYFIENLELGHKEYDLLKKRLSANSDKALMQHDVIIAYTVKGMHYVPKGIITSSKKSSQ